jgi:hypothetical protein
MQKFQLFTTSPLKMRACGTGRKFAGYDQRDDVRIQEALIKLANFTILCKNETKDITTKKAS